MEIRKAYRISKPDLGRNGIPENSAVGRWLVNYGVIGRDDLSEMTVHETSITLESFRKMLSEVPIPDWDHEQPTATPVWLYDFEPATAHYDPGWVEINNDGDPIAYDNSGII